MSPSEPQGSSTHSPAHSLQSYLEQSPKYLQFVTWLSWQPQVLSGMADPDGMGIEPPGDSCSSQICCVGMQISHTRMNVILFYYCCYYYYHHFSGGVSWEGLRWGSLTSSHQSSDLTYNPQGGIGFLDGYVIDTHFAWVSCWAGGYEFCCPNVNNKHSLSLTG